VTSQGFVEITPGYTLDDCPTPDIVVVPGGNVPDQDPELQAWVRRCSGSAELVMSVCNGALLLGAVGLLDGREATTHHGSLQGLALGTPKATVLSNRRFVDGGGVLTCAGVSAGIDGALHVVERLLGNPVARDVARYMEYDWRPEELARLHAEPGQSVRDGGALQLARLAHEQGLERALAELRKSGEAPGEQELTRAASSLLHTGQVEQALALFRLVTRAHPDSPGAHDSLSEALEATGDPVGAREHAQRALACLERPDLVERPNRWKARLRNGAASRLVRLGEGDRSALRFACPPCEHPCDELLFLEATPCPGCAMALAER
jgi:putative intracellular protease/amidase